MIDTSRPKPSLVQLGTRGSTPANVRTTQIDETAGAGFRIDHLRQSPIRETLLARIADRDGHDVVPSIEAAHRPLEILIEKVADDDDHRATAADLFEITRRAVEIGYALR